MFLTNTSPTMSFSDRLRKIRRDRGLTQVQMADLMGVHLNTIKKYEVANAQPSMDVLKKIAVSLSVTTDELIFDKDEREPNQDLRLAFEAVSHMNPEDKQTVISLIEGMILKHQAKSQTSTS